MEDFLVVGDSDTFGMGVEHKETFPERLEDLLNNHLSRTTHGITRFEVINMGVLGYNTRQEVELLRDKGVAFAPDQIIVQFNENDYMGTQRAPSPLLRWVLIRSYLARVLQYKVEILRLLRADVGDPLTGFKNVLEGFRDLKILSQERNFKVIVIFLDKPSIRTIRIQKECRDLGFTIVDMRKYLTFVPFQKRFGPDLQPSAYSHYIVARVLYDLIVKSHPVLFLP